MGDGVIACLKDQKAMESYGITSTEMHLKTTLLVDLDVMVCKEDLDRFGISEDMILDADDMGADKKIQIVPFSSISTVIENANHVLFF